MSILAEIRRECPRASREWRAALYRRAKRGGRVVRMSPKEQANQLHRRESRRLVERRAARSMDHGLLQWEPK